MDSSDFDIKIRRSSRTSRKKILKDFVPSDNRLSLSKQSAQLSLETNKSEQPLKISRTVATTKRSRASEDSDNENYQTNNQLNPRRSFRLPNCVANSSADISYKNNMIVSPPSETGENSIKITGALTLDKAVFNEMGQNNESFVDSFFDLPIEEQMFVDSELFDTVKPQIKTYQKKGPPVQRCMSYTNIRTYGLPRAPIFKDIFYQVSANDLPAPDPTKDPLATDDCAVPVSCEKSERSFGKATISRPRESQPRITFVDVKQVKNNNSDISTSTEAVAVYPLKEEQEELQQEVVKEEDTVATEEDLIDRTVKWPEEVKVELPPFKQDVNCQDETIVGTEGPFISPKFYPGELLWGRVSCKSVFWPCIVLFDVDHSYLKLTGPFVSVQSYFVRFFADNGRSSWISSNNLQPYDGLEKFKDKLKDSKVLSNQISTLLYRKDPEMPTLWEQAISEANSLLSMSFNVRMSEFFLWFPSLHPDYSIVKHTTTQLMEESQQSEPEPQKKVKPLILKIRYFTPKNKKKSVSQSPASTNVKTKATENQSRKDTPHANTKVSKKVNKKNSSGASSTKKKKYEEDADLKSPPKKKLKLSCGSPNFDMPVEKANYEVFYQSTCSIFKDDGLTASQLQAAVYQAWCDTEKGKQVAIDEQTQGSSAQDDTQILKFYHLMTGRKNEKVCFLCHQTTSEPLGKAKVCKGGCWQYYHVSCGKLKTSNGLETCYNCKNMKHACFICKQRKAPVEPIPTKIAQNPAQENASDATLTDVESDTENYIANLKHIENCEETFGVKKGGLVQCSVKKCGHFYHVSCVHKLPQTLIQGQHLTCPMHTCHTCVCDNPQVSRFHVPKEKLVSCVLCPTTYHTGDHCIPSGTQLLTLSQVICPKHDVNTANTGALRKSTNCNWCFLCTKGGELLCCDGCPATVHTACLKENKIPIADPYYCEDCLSGRFPLFGEVVWVKHASFRWWPARVIFPDDAPEAVYDQSHKEGEYIVQFFGSKDYTWTNNHRTFTFHGDDKDEKFTQKGKQMVKQFSAGILEAGDVHREYVAQKAARDAILIPMMKPPTYTRIKINKVLTTMKMQTDSVEACDCSPDQEHPCLENCINKDLNAECIQSKCRAGVRCENQKFTKREYPQLEVFATKDRGWGLKTLVDLEAEQFVIEYVGEVIDDAEFQLRVQRKVENRDVNYYFLAMNQFYIDAGPRGNPARFMNHSCKPNCKAQKWNVKGETRVGLFTNQPIKADTELTFDYNLELLGSSKQKCYCASDNCSGFIGIKSRSLKLDSETAEKTKNLKIKKKNKEIASKNETGKSHAKQKKTKDSATKNDTKSTKCSTKSAKLAKKSKVVKKRFHEEVCFQCEDTGDLIMCQLDTCTRVYHEACIPSGVKPSLASINGQQFKCPWHFCRTCLSKAEVQCFHCDIGYCKDHSCLLPSSKLGFICPSHT